MNPCLFLPSHSIGGDHRNEVEDGLLVNYGLRRCGIKRDQDDRRAALWRSLPWRRATHRRLPVEVRLLAFEVLCCHAARNGEGVGEAARRMPIEDIEGIMKALSVV